MIAQGTSRPAWPGCILLVACLGAALGLSGCDDGDRRTDVAMANRGANIDPADVEDAPVPEMEPVTHFTAARLFEAKGDYLNAAAEYSKALFKNPDFYAAYMRLSACYLQLGWQDKAIELMQTAVQRWPARAGPRNNLGFAHLVIGDALKAEGYFREALQIDPTFTRAQVNLGFALGAQGHFDQAFHAFREAVSDADAYHNLGEVYRKTGRLELAIECFEQALAINPDMQDTRAQLLRLRSIVQADRAASRGQIGSETSPSTRPVGPSGLTIRDLPSNPPPEPILPADFSPPAARRPGVDPQTSALGAQGDDSAAAREAPAEQPVVQVPSAQAPTQAQPSDAVAVVTEPAAHVAPPEPGEVATPAAPIEPEQPQASAVDPAANPPPAQTPPSAPDPAPTAATPATTTPDPPVESRPGPTMRVVRQTASPVAPGDAPSPGVPHAR